VRFENGAVAVNPYRFLDLAPFESNPDAIIRAVARARAKIGNARGGPLDERSQELLRRIKQAEAILTDPDLKQKCDTRLLSQARSGGTVAEPPSGADSERRAETTRATPGARYAPPVRPWFVVRWAASLEPNQRWKLILTVVCMIGVAFAAVRWSIGPARFPEHHGAVLRLDASKPALPHLPPAPAKPSMPTLPVGVTRLVAGLETERSAYSPTLSGDLRTIVYSAPSARTSQDLYLAYRDNPAGRFSKPRALRLFSAIGSYFAPALSGDGLVLVFLRIESGETDPRVWISRRRNATDGFAVAERVEIPMVADAGGERPESLQLTDDGMFVRMVLAGTNVTERHRYALTPYPATDSTLNQAELVPVFNPWAYNIFSSDGLRAYVATPEKGVFLSNRQDVGGPFGMPGGIQSLSVEKTGQVDGPFWVSPKEDLLIYCSAAGNKGIGNRQIWVIRYR
jgi:hypothetical protein